MQVAFIGLGNVGGKLAGNLARSGHALVVHDLNEAVGYPGRFFASGLNSIRHR